MGAKKDGRRASLEKGVRSEKANLCNLGQGKGKKLQRACLSGAGREIGKHRERIQTGSTAYNTRELISWIPSSEGGGSGYEGSPELLLQKGGSWVFGSYSWIRRSRMKERSNIREKHACLKNLEKWTKRKTLDLFGEMV